MLLSIIKKYKQRKETINALQHYQFFLAQHAGLSLYFNNLNELTFSIDHYRKEFAKEYNNLRFDLLNEKELDKLGFKKWDKNCIGHMIPIWLYVLLPDTALVVDSGCLSDNLKTESIKQKKDLNRPYGRLGLVSVMLFYNKKVI